MLTHTPRLAIPLLQSRLRPMPHADPVRVARLLVDLDSEHFAVREKATAELAGMGEVAQPTLQRALAAEPPLEVRHRVKGLLENLQGPVPPLHQLRTLRAVEVLEHIGTPEAREVLKSLAGGAPEARLTREAKTSLDRLARRPGDRL